MDKKVSSYTVIQYEQYKKTDNRADYVVLAKNGLMWVTWECTNGNDFYWGHYYQHEKDARADYHRRLAEEYEYLN